MGKAAENERIKLRANFYNNIAVALMVTIVAVPYFGSFVNSWQINRTMLALIEGRLPFSDPAATTIINTILAGITAFIAALLVRKRAELELQKLKD